ncbi:hypothetical protein RYX36_028624 [Vicia faba]
MAVVSSWNLGGGGGGGSGDRWETGGNTITTWWIMARTVVETHGGGWRHVSSGCWGKEGGRLKWQQEQGKKRGFS